MVKIQFDNQARQSSSGKACKFKKTTNFYLIKFMFTYFKFNYFPS